MKEEKFEKVVRYKNKAAAVLGYFNLLGGIFILLIIIQLLFLDVPNGFIAVAGFVSGFDIAIGIWIITEERKVYWRKVK